MTTQTPYGPASAEHPHLAAGHGQYPPAGYQHTEYAQHSAPGYAVPEQTLPSHSLPGYPQQDAPVYPEQAMGYPPEAAPAYPQAAGYPPEATPAYPQAAGYSQEATPAYPQAAGYSQEGAGYPEPVAYADPAVPGQVEPYWYQGQQDTEVGAHDATAFPGIQHPGESAYPEVLHQADPAPQQAAYPPSAYPTAPPWATPHAPAPAAPVPGGEPDALVVTPFGVVPQVGGLLVPYPEEMRNAPRAQAPAVWPVAAFTFFFGAFGAISAARRSSQARRGRNGVAPYWVTFGVMMAVSSFFWLVMAVSVGVPVYLSVREGATVAALEENVLHDGQLEKANVSADSADCRAAGEWVGGRRDFLCELKLSDGRTGRVLVNSDDQGNWRPLEDS
ncbi:hypothetical protein [Couchioplanes azureus]|uniref:hypothetical protein n=1 Tax=Couchioplanes caeruleus TaxID=56438 RepID=UPI00167020EE|nr:hypothetical protein [Couchioplanes caeruleus]GGQ79374.1 hypothetical protein GCM10010166_56670 [Couchioplanes caeruleus subsp. azureus]